MIRGRKSLCTSRQREEQGNTPAIGVWLASGRAGGAAACLTSTIPHGSQVVWSLQGCVDSQ